MSADMTSENTVMETARVEETTSMWLSIQNIVQHNVHAFLTTLASEYQLDSEKLKTQWNEFAMVAAEMPSTKTKKRRGRRPRTATTTDAEASSVTTTTKKRGSHMTPYNLFCKEERKLILQEEPDLKFGDISKRISMRWKLVTAEQKQELKARIDREKEESSRTITEDVAAEEEDSTTTTVTSSSPSLLTTTVAGGGDWTPPRRLVTVHEDVEDSPPFRLTTTPRSEKENDEDEVDETMIEDDEDDEVDEREQQRNTIRQELMTKTDKELRRLCSRYGLPKHSTVGAIIDALSDRLMPPVSVTTSRGGSLHNDDPIESFV